ncbi:MAG TPA: discoidin domain-containing protein, partial [Thermoanaerobaculia bacterium]
MSARSSVPAILAVLAVLFAARPLSAQTLDDFSTLAGWTAAPSDGVRLDLSKDQGALRLDFDFHGGAGYAVAHKAFALDLPPNWQISFRIRGDAPVNNLEFKLIDPSGQNVWWINRRNFQFPHDWREVRTRKRQIEFAWGPAGGGEMKQVAAIEFAVTAGTGGKGTVWIDDLKFTELPPEHPYNRTPTVTTSGDTVTWDFLESREYGGLVIDWSRPASYTVEISDDGKTWTAVREVKEGNGGRDYLYLPETESRYLRIRVTGASNPPKPHPLTPSPLRGEGENSESAHPANAGPPSPRSGEGPGVRPRRAGRAETTVALGLRHLDVKPLDWAPTINAFFEQIAKDAPRGSCPRSFSGEQEYWTVVGVDADSEEGLLGEDGALEVGQGSFSIEPFLFVDGKLIAWSDVQTSQSLAEGYLPIPTV